MGEMCDKRKDTVVWVINSKKRSADFVLEIGWSFSKTWAKNLIVRTMVKAATCEAIGSEQSVLARSLEVDFSSREVTFQTGDCEQGEFWSYEYERCEPCTKCAERQYQFSKCTAYQNTVCEWCMVLFPRRNDDYIEKCGRIVSAQEVFENERQLNTRIGARIVGSDQPEHTFWNFDESTWHLFNVDSAELPGTKIDERKLSLRMFIGGHVGRVLMQCLFFVFALLAFYLLIRAYLRRNKHRTFITSIPTPHFSDEQTQVIMNSAKELEKIIGKGSYSDQKRPKPEFV